MLNFNYIFTTLQQIILLKKPPFNNAFQCLVFCIISLRTKDSVSYAQSLNLFAVAPNALAISALSSKQIASLIYPAGFFRRKAEQILKLSRTMVAQGTTEPPNNLKELLKIEGVGLKTANLVLSRGFNIPAICVDIHVHRICNRLGLIKTETPDQSEVALRAVMPIGWWIASNELLVGFGQQICQPIKPKCPQCPFNGQCPTSLH
jgi:endonuclease-3